MSEIQTPQDGVLEPRAYTLRTRRGPVDTLLYESLGAKEGALLAGGGGGGFDTPALGLYSRLGEELLRHQMSTMRLKYRHSTDLAEAVYDVLAGVDFLVGLASQSYGTEAVSQLSPRSLLLIHGLSDAVLPPSCSLSIHERARGRKELELVQGAGHVLDEAAERVFTRVRDWLLQELRA
ncbi:hypothetical protein ACN28E_07645 [Archangium lansingense]|uniref:hypothetical protein n=1 Tax=Archangium lansingense TaxID=2995310 RepID=UPI003B7C48BF